MMVIPCAPLPAVDMREDSSGGGMVIVPMLGREARVCLVEAVGDVVRVSSVELNVLTGPLPDPSDEVPGMLPPYPLSTSSSACLEAVLTAPTAPKVDVGDTTGLLTGCKGVQLPTRSLSSE